MSCIKCTGQRVRPYRRPLYHNSRTGYRFCPYCASTLPLKPAPSVAPLESKHGQLRFLYVDKSRLDTNGIAVAVRPTYNGWVYRTKFNGTWIEVTSGLLPSLMGVTGAAVEITTDDLLAYFARCKTTFKDA
jgi:hypothetical protein